MIVLAFGTTQRGAMSDTEAPRPLQSVRATPRFARFACWTSAFLALPAVAAGQPASNAAPQTGRDWISAYISGSFSGDQFIAHVPRMTMTFALVRGSGGREIEIPTGPPLACVGESDAFFERYNRIAAAFPIIRVKFDRAKDRFRTSGGKAIAEARRRTAAEVIALVEQCEEREKAELAEEVRTKLRTPYDPNDEMSFKQLRSVFLGIEASNGITDWRKRRSERPCVAIFGKRLKNLLPFQSHERCTVSVDGPGTWDEPGTIGSVTVIGGPGLGPGTSEFDVTFSRVELP